MSKRDKHPLKAAVIGVGYLGRFHAQKYARMDGVQLVAVADLQADRATRVAGELGVEAVADFHALLPRVDLVSVVSPTPTHARVVEACLQAGVHVLVEKPITTTLEEADHLIALADQQGVVLQVGHIKRFHPAVRALLDSGMLNNPRFIDAQRFAPFKNRALDVDVVLDLMIHDVDLILHFVSSEITSIDAVGSGVITGKWDLANARLRFANGCIANISASRVARDATRRLRLFQSDALFDLDFMRPGLALRRRGSGTRLVDGLPVPTIDEQEFPLTPTDALEAEIRAFCRSVRTGEAVQVTGRDGRRALEVVMAIRQAIADWAQQGAGG
ncbi:MAG: Gfo/Idh/MocA family oxidoreductase [Magnetococcales bacterium]|nr:Gfo/Idh/MocA family oxidoreductase [Magnetococcales bacterium]NGZ06210.1 Gfo/Idh/MocA family oxidoreductase [Magnetococcales bacterium]